ncbi:MAG: TIGR02584 family CRISPR-associated protein [Syntrophorhabdus sp.]|nr:TIGR02584 family CRISPR-associated protein [Syntrophorhabdus sp.]
MKILPFKEVLILVVGTTPQIVTETIYGLVKQKPPIKPEEIFIITTSVGKATTRARLLQSNLFQTFVKEYGLGQLDIPEDHFIIARNSCGNGLPDITDEMESEIMGDLITSFIRTLTEDQKIRLHCSIAGGRKTMSFYMGAALQLFGRPWDRLYHVLVSPEFESNPEFFYKPKRNRIITTRLPDGTIKKLNTRDATIRLAELPFIRLRDKLSLQGMNFKELVKEGQNKIDTATFQPELDIDLSARTVRIGNRLIEMIPVQLMVYTALLRQKIQACVHPDRPYCYECTDCFLVLQDLLARPTLEKMSEDYRRMYRENPFRAEELKAKWQDRIGTETLRQNISKISRTIREQLPEEALWPLYTISTVKKYAGTKYGIRVEKGKISIK